MSSILRKVVQYWESEGGNTGYTVTIDYDDAGAGTVTDSRGVRALEPLIKEMAELPEAHFAALVAVRNSVAAGELTPAAGDEAIARLNVERVDAEMSSGTKLTDHAPLANLLNDTAPPAVASAAENAHERVFGVDHSVSAERVAAGESFVGVQVDSITARGASGVTLGTEPKPVAKSGPLPPDFPYLDKLHAADPPINTYFQLAKFADDYTKIPGVGPAGAKAITEAVSKKF